MAGRLAPMQEWADRVRSLRPRSSQGQIAISFAACRPRRYAYCGWGPARQRLPPPRRAGLHGDAEPN